MLRRREGVLGVRKAVGEAEEETPPPPTPLLPPPPTPPTATISHNPTTTTSSVHSHQLPKHFATPESSPRTLSITHSASRHHSSLATHHSHVTLTSFITRHAPHSTPAREEASERVTKRSTSHLSPCPSPVKSMFAYRSRPVLRVPSSPQRDRESPPVLRNSPILGS
ncbi:mucin-2-like [Portunus trituberculatus]|uniref:mucin-2-like n=1 Tax=Portunus trituberculatus TaxID=210409 RepID=UPI001E1D18EB|nr:mucin-2-like [Portunus trituberculatus]